MDDVTEAPGARLRSLAPRSFVRPSALPGSSSSVRSALSLAARKGELLRVRKGLYYKGAKGRYGMTRPSTEEIAREVLGTVGVGPAGYSAARRLGLTTQVPAHLHVAVAGPVPEPISDVRIHRRNNMARRDLNETEIALLEVLRDPSTLVESGWEALVPSARALIRSREIDLERLTAAITGEGSRSARDNFDRLAVELSQER
ncbi:DUF6088 family protein [Glaciibacter superstes]|uniref:DUF6088 family protein n=1 Tax=Glaciibacter superstes TaxID=501023 RepID=UPI001FE1ADC6|nr:DUF6088 family protein [Glaciibacter superstes]